MDAPFVENHVERYSRGANASSGVAQSQPYVLRDANDRQKYNPEMVLDLPEPAPKSISPYEDRIGYAVLDMLPEVVGCKYDAVSIAALYTLRPSIIRTCLKGSKLSQDSVWWRVTVHLDQGVITRVQQEVKVVLPMSCANGRMFKLSLNFKDEKYDTETLGIKTPTHPVQANPRNARK